jgi:dTDP-4-amino-4,6-dideoxygalactose transaminase
LPAARLVMEKSLIPLYKPHVPPSSAAAFEGVLRSGQIAGDGNLPEFEEKLRQFVGARHLAATAEFSRSIEMALRMAGVGPGHAVMLSPLACLATTMPILQTGAQTVWCDIDPNTGSLHPDEIARKYSPAVKAVLFYHWVGVPGDISGVLQAAAQVGIKVIEDAGEALGAERDGLRIGAHGSDYSVFSFSPVRHITTGEGAAITFREADQYELARLWRRYGIPPDQFRDCLGEIDPACDISIPGFHNYMNRLAGALGNLQMEYLPGIVEACRRNGQLFDRELSAVPGIRLLKTGPCSIPSYWVYCFLCEHRDRLLKKLRDAQIYSSRVHIRNDSYSCFGGMPADLAGVAEFEAKQLCIPCGWWLTEEDRERIVQTIRSGW